MWLFPLNKPWTYSPIGYVCAIAWNISEILQVRLPHAEKVFGAAIGRKPKQVNKTGANQ